jgi:streptogramin lyase
VLLVLAIDVGRDRVEAATDCRASGVPASTGTFGIGGYGNLLAFGDGALWVATEETAGRLSISRIEPRPGAEPELVHTLAAAGDARFAVDGGELWIAEPRGPLTRVELSTGATRALRPFPRGDEPSELVLTRDHVWVTSSGGRLAKVSRETARVVRRVRLAETLGDVVAAYGSVWVSTADTGRVIGVEPAGLRRQARIAVGGTTIELVAGSGSLWVDLGLRADTVARIDPGSRRVTARIPNGGDAFSLAAGVGALWITNYGRATVTRLDLESGESLGTTPVGKDPKGIALGAGSAWVMNAGECSVTRIVAR